jgi:hypothetical protein
MEVAGFNQEWEASEQSAQCCTTSSFRVQLSGTPSVPWNKSAERVFIDSFINRWDLEDTPKIRAEISTAFKSRIKSLIRDYRDKQKSLDERKLLKAQHNKYERKSTVSIYFRTL